MWYGLPIRQFFTRDQNDVKVTAINHHMAFNILNNQYHLWSYKKPQKDECKQLKWEN